MSLFLDKTKANQFGMADLVYVLENDALKEYIILEDSAAPNSYNFLFTLDGVTLQETDTGAAFLNEAGEAVFYLGGLFAVDANGVPTDDLTYTFQTVKNNIVGVTVTLDPEYLGATDRAFPVVIDPTVRISSSSTADACVCSYTPDTNYQMAAQLRTGFCTDYGIRRSYIRFEIPDSIEPGSVINAYMDIEKLSGVAPTVRAYRVTGSWSSGSITWRSKPNYATSLQSTQSAQLSSGSSWYRMNVTSIVNAWVNGQYINYGFALVDSVENNSSHWTTIYSSDANSPHKPELYINYSGDDIPTTLYYGSRPYQSAPEGEAANCMGYALEYKFFVQGTDLGLSRSDFVGETTEEILDLVYTGSITWMTDHIGSSNYRIIDNFDSDISTGWFRVVLRVGFDDLDGDNVYDIGEKVDYHWWYQTNENQGQWADKPGGNASRRQTGSSGTVDPTASPWSGYVSYDSEGIYFEVKDMRVITW